MGSSGGVLIIVVLVNAVPKFDTRNQFWKLVFPLNWSQFFSASLMILKTINSMVFIDRQPFDL